jgi:hypothetical protein
MKTLQVSLFLLITFALLQGCKKEENASPTQPGKTFASTPEAKPVNDTKSGGIYKGTFVGSSGSIKVVLQDNTISILLTFNNVTRTLTTNGLSSWSSGQAISNVTFTSGDWSVVLSVNADGSNPNVVITIPNHANIGVSLIKETSTELVRVFEGTFTGSQTGVWNLVIQGSSIKGIGRANGDTSNEFINGTLTGNSIILKNSDNEVVGGGTLSGNSISGSWNNGVAGGNWSGSRTL